jgi:hypothetical protein
LRFLRDAKVYIWTRTSEDRKFVIERYFNRMDKESSKLVGFSINYNQNLSELAAVLSAFPSIEIPKSLNFK